MIFGKLKCPGGDWNQKKQISLKGIEGLSPFKVCSNNDILLMLCCKFHPLQTQILKRICFCITVVLLFTHSNHNKNKA